VPLGKGEYERRDKYMGPGKFRKVRTDVTIVRNKTFATR
jgi:stalled ribosome alternative rescue factor ArfA